MDRIRKATPADLHNQIVDFALDQIALQKTANTEHDSEALMRAIAHEFPDAPRGLVSRAIEDALDVLTDENNVRIAENEDGIAFANRCIELFERFPDSETVGDAVQAGVDAGDQFALWLSNRPDRLEREIEIKRGQE